jgi:hypothetical protein
MLRAFGMLSGFCAAASGTLFAQDLFPRHYLNGGVGAGLPRGQINEFFVNRPGMTVNYSYRFHRYFQADLGYEIIFGAAQIRDPVNTQLGTQLIRDRQHFVTFGGRGVMPLARGRVLISGGGGGAYMRYQESISQPNANFRIACPVCIGRGGFGGYGLISAKFSNRWQRYWIGVTSKVIRGSSEGQPFAGLPTTRTKDHWINTFVEVGFAF